VSVRGHALGPYRKTPDSGRRAMEEVAAQLAHDGADFVVHVRNHT
jgi:hypothetical protein